MRPGEWRRLRAEQAADPRGGPAGNGETRAGGEGDGRAAAVAAAEGGFDPRGVGELGAPHAAADWLQTDNGAGPAFPRVLLAGGAAPPPPIGGSDCLSLAGPAWPCPPGHRPARAGAPQTLSLRRLPQGRRAPCPRSPSRRDRPCLPGSSGLRGKKNPFLKVFSVEREGRSHVWRGAAVPRAGAAAEPGLAPSRLVVGAELPGPPRALAVPGLWAHPPWPGPWEGNAFSWRTVASGFRSSRRFTARTARGRRRVAASPGQGVAGLTGTEGGSSSACVTRVGANCTIWMRQGEKRPAWGARAAPSGSRLPSALREGGGRGGAPRAAATPSSCDG